MSENLEKRSTELLQDLGLKTYEARSFTALCRIPSGTAKQISEITEVPRTRVYDAMESLEERQLIEIQPGSPKRFRAVPINEAVLTLRNQYFQQLSSLEEALQDLEPAGQINDETDEVWVVAGEERIQNRLENMIDNAEKEIILVLEPDSATSILSTSAMVNRVHDAVERGITVRCLRQSKSGSKVDDCPYSMISFDGFISKDRAGADTEAVYVDSEELLVMYSTQTIQGETSGVWVAGADNGLLIQYHRLLSTISKLGSN